MADFVERSKVAIHEWSDVYGVGYRPEYFGGTSRFQITRTAITKMTGSALLGECTFTIKFLSNQTDDPPSQRNSGYNYAVDYEVYIAGARRGTARLFSRTQYIDKNTTYTRTLKATNIPLGTATTVSAYIRTVNDRPSSQALLFDSRNQGGDTLSGLPLGIQRSNFSSFSSFTVKNSATTFNATVTRVSSGTTHYASLWHGGNRIKLWSDLDNFTSLSLTLAESQTLLSSLSSVKSATVELRIGTAYGGTQLYIQSRTATVTVGESPTIGSVGIADSSGALTAVGALVQNISNITLSINTVSAGYGATISTYGYEWLGQTHSNKTSNTLKTGIVNRSGSQTFTGRISNSRGQLATRSRTDTVLPWSAPKSTSVQVRRCTSTGTLDPAGSYIRVTGSHSVSPLTVGTTNKNTLRVLVRYRVAGTTTWTTPLNKTYTAGTVSTSESHTLGGGTLDPTKTYEFEVIAYDRYANTTVTGLIPTERVLISKVRNEGVGFGKIRERGIIDAKGDVYVDGDVNISDELRVNGHIIVNHTGMIGVKDTRDVETPTDIGMGVDYEFKRSSTLGIPSTATYSAVQTFQAWSNTSGGNVHQVAYTASSNNSKVGRMFYRTTPIGADSWGSWVELTGSSGGGGDGGVVTTFSSTINGTLYQAMAEAYSAGAFPSGRSFQMMFTNAGSVYSFQGNADYDGRVYGLLLSSLSQRIVTRTSTGTWGIKNITTTTY